MTPRSPRFWVRSSAAPLSLAGSTAALPPGDVSADGDAVAAEAAGVSAGADDGAALEAAGVDAGEAGACDAGVPLQALKMRTATTGMASTFVNFILTSSCATVLSSGVGSHSRSSRAKTRTSVNRLTDALPCPIYWNHSKECDEQKYENYASRVRAHA